MNSVSGAIFDRLILTRGSIEKDVTIINFCKHYDLIKICQRVSKILSMNYNVTLEILFITRH